MRAAIATVLMAISTSAIASNDKLYSVNPGAFIFHAYEPKTDYTQYFDNQYIAVERKLNAQSDYSLSVGTLVNSFSNRCMLLGVRKDWWEKGHWTFKGGYAYAGEFFFSQFSHCGDEGIYRNIKDAVGIGFAPYIYHALQYDFNDHFGLEGGVILPGIVVLSMQFHF
ncbi:Uncharacterised protein [Yersinia nurmii]|nr:Uncharacterised protein [Yersinia nurmii]